MLKPLIVSKTSASSTGCTINAKLLLCMVGPQILFYFFKTLNSLCSCYYYAAKKELVLPNLCIFTHFLPVHHSELSPLDRNVHIHILQIRGTHINAHCAHQQQPLSLARSRTHVYILCARTHA